MTTLSLPSPAKLNLFLHITGRRPDGYHELQTLFQFLDFGDTLSFTPADHGDVRLTPKLQGVEPETNLILRAARALQTESPAGFFGVDIHLDKRIPMGGGLGGGSSNAATTLLALNHLWGLRLPVATLSAIGLTLGADVPVFLSGQAAWAEGVGEHLTPATPPEDWYLVLIPDCNISTAAIFDHQRLTRDSRRIRIAPAFDGNDSSPNQDLLNRLDSFHNDCETTVCSLYPQVKMGMEWLERQCGNARLTGTGACIFSRFPTESGAQSVLMKKPSGIEGFVAKGLNKSPLQKRLCEFF